MPCPSCNKDPKGTEWFSDPLRWDLDPPCEEKEWDYVKVIPGAPDYVAEAKFGVYMNKICRGCYHNRLDIAKHIRWKIRDRGGLEFCPPPCHLVEEYEEAHDKDKHMQREAKISGMQSEAGKELNGKFCTLLEQDPETKRWTVRLVSGEKRSIKDDNLECSRQIDKDAFEAKVVQARKDPMSYFNSMKEENKAKGEARPLGKGTTWPKVKGIHPGAVVRLKGLTGATELNGRKGRCITFDQETGRWKVDLGDGYKNIKQDNMTPAPNEKPPTKMSAEAEAKELGGDEARRAKLTEKERKAEDYGWDG